MLSVLRVPLVLAFSGLLLLAQDPAYILEGKVAADPNSEELRSALMDAYIKANDSTAFEQQVLWLIENRPESRILNTRGKLTPSSPVFEQAESAWETALQRHPKSGAVLFNAAVFLTVIDPVRAITLLEHGRKIAPGRQNYAEAEGSAYLMAFRLDANGNPLPPLNAESAEALRSRLEASSDAELLSAAGKVLATDGQDTTKKIGVRLMERATLIDPRNQQWRAALEDSDSPDALKYMRVRAIQISSSAAEANLIEKVDPAYPVLAQSGRVQGEVKLTAFIDAQGGVRRLDLISGPALLVGAAKDAVLQWQYKPYLVNEKPVPVIADVSVTFTLSQP